MKNNLDMSVGHVAKRFSARIDSKILVNAATSVVNFYAPDQGGGMYKRPGFRLVCPYHFGRFNVFGIGKGVIFGRPGNELFAAHGTRLVVHGAGVSVGNKSTIVIDNKFSVNEYAYVNDLSTNSYTFLTGISMGAEIPANPNILVSVNPKINGANFQFEELLGTLTIHSDGVTHILEMTNDDEIEPFDTYCKYGQSFRSIPEEKVTEKIKLLTATSLEGIKSFEKDKYTEYTASTRYMQRNILAVFYKNKNYGELLVSSMSSPSDPPAVDGLFGTWYSYIYGDPPALRQKDVDQAVRIGVIPSNATWPTPLPDDLIKLKGRLYTKQSSMEWNALGKGPYTTAGTKVDDGGKVVMHGSVGRINMLGAIDNLMFIGTHHNILYTQDLLTKPISHIIYPKGAASVQPVNIGNNLIYVHANGKTLMFISKPPEAAPLVREAPIFSDFFEQHGGVKKLVALAWSETAIIALTYCGQMVYLRASGDTWAAFPWVVDNSFVNDITTLETPGQPDLLYAAIELGDKNWLCFCDEPQFPADTLYQAFLNYNLDYSHYIEARRLATMLSATCDFYVTSNINLKNVNIIEAVKTDHVVDVEYIYGRYPLFALNEFNSGRLFDKVIDLHGSWIEFGLPILAYWQSMPGSVQGQGFSDLAILTDKPATYTDQLDTSNPDERDRLAGSTAIELFWQSVPTRYNVPNSAQRVMFFHKWPETLLICGIRY